MDRQPRHCLCPSFMVLALLSSLIVDTTAAPNSTCNDAADHVTQYLLTFLAPGGSLVTSPDNLALCLVLSNPSATTPAEVHVEPHNHTLTLQPGQVNAQVCFNGSAAPNGSMKQTTPVGLMITAKHCDAIPIVHGSVKTHGIPSVRTNAAFAVSPVTSLGTDYVLVTHCETHHCFAGIVAQQQATSVTVKLKLRPSNASLVYNGADYFSGGAIKEGLDRLQVMQIMCQACDMSGSRVTSSSPVAVLSGGEFTTVGGSGSSDMDSVLEYLPPINTLGTRYVIAKDLEALYTVKVVATHGDTIFFVSVLKKCYAANTVESNSWTLPLLAGSKSTVLNSTHPVLVSLLIAGGLEGPTASRMTVLQPVSQWNTSYHVVQAFPTEHNHLYLVGHLSNFVQGCLRYGGAVVNLTQSLRMSSTVDGSPTWRVAQVGLSYSVSHKELTCSPGCENCEPFGGYVDGLKSKKRRGWAVPLATFTDPSEQGQRTAYPASDVIDKCNELKPDTTPIIAQDTTAVTNPPTSANLGTTTSHAELTSTPVTTSQSPSFETSTEITSKSASTPKTTSQAPETSTHKEITTQSTFIETSPHPPPLETSTYRVSTSQSTSTPKKTTSRSPSLETTTHHVNASSAPEKSSCMCRCRRMSPADSTDHHGLSLLAETSRQRNRKRSAPDTRISAAVMGCAGVGVLVSVCVVIVCSDVTAFLCTSKKPRFGFAGQKCRSGQVCPQLN